MANRVYYTTVPAGADGRPVPFASVAVNGRSVATPISVYADPTTVTAIPTPILTDATGRVQFWVDNGISYDVTLSGAALSTFTDHPEALSALYFQTTINSILATLASGLSAGTPIVTEAGTPIYGYAYLGDVGPQSQPGVVLAGDTVLYRSAANTLYTPGELDIGSTLKILSNDGSSSAPFIRGNSQYLVINSSSTDGLYLNQDSPNPTRVGYDLVVGNVDSTKKLFFGGAQDTSLYRRTAGGLQTDSYLGVSTPPNAAYRINTQGPVSISNETTGSIRLGDGHITKTAGSNFTLDSGFQATGDIYAQNTGPSQVRIGGVGASLAGISLGSSGDTFLYRATAGGLEIDNYLGVATPPNAAYRLSVNGAALVGGNMQVAGAGGLAVITEVVARSGVATQVSIGAVGPSNQSGISFQNGESGSTIYRSNTGTLHVDGAFGTGGVLTSQFEVHALSGGNEAQLGRSGPNNEPGIKLGSGADTSLYRITAGGLQTDGYLGLATPPNAAFRLIVGGPTSIGGTDGVGGGLAIRGAGGSDWRIYSDSGPSLKIGGNGAGSTFWEGRYSSDPANLFQPPSTDAIVTAFRGASAGGQTKDLTQWQNPTGTVFSRIDAQGNLTTNYIGLATPPNAAYRLSVNGPVNIAGNLTVGATPAGSPAISSLGPIYIQSPNLLATPLVIQGILNQSSDMTQWWNGNGAVVASIGGGQNGTGWIFGSGFGMTNGGTDINNTTSFLRLYGTGSDPTIRMRTSVGIGTTNEISSVSVPFTVQAAPNQTANLTNWNIGTAVVASISSAGTIMATPHAGNPAFTALGMITATPGIRFADGTVITSATGLGGGGGTPGPSTPIVYSAPNKYATTAPGISGLEVDNYLAIATPVNAAYNFIVNGSSDLTGNLTIGGNTESSGWIQSDSGNVAAFGGDPTRVDIGRVAGGTFSGIAFQSLEAGSNIYRAAAGVLQSDGQFTATPIRAIAPTRLSDGKAISPALTALGLITATPGIRFGDGTALTSANVAQGQLPSTLYATPIGIVSTMLPADVQYFDKNVGVSGLVIYSTPLYANGVAGSSALFANALITATPGVAFSDGTVVTSGYSAWTTFSLNGAQFRPGNTATPSYRLVNGIEVLFKGSIYTAGGSTPFLGIPAAIRPPTQVAVSAPAMLGAGASLVITSTGNGFLSSATGTTYALDGLGYFLA